MAACSASDGLSAIPSNNTGRGILNSPILIWSFWKAYSGLEVSSIYSRFYDGPERQMGVHSSIFGIRMAKLLDLQDIRLSILEAVFRSRASGPAIWFISWFYEQSNVEHLLRTVLSRLESCLRLVNASPQRWSSNTCTLYLKYIIKLPCMFFN